MCVQEKRAWFSLTVVVVTLALYSGIVLVFGFRPAAMAVFALLGLLGVEPLIGRRAIARGAAVIDERDREISMMAVAAAFAVVWVLAVAAVMTPLYVLGVDGVLTIRTATLATTVYPAMGVVYIVRALVMVVLYRRQAHA